jgi:hypothetical protein
MAQNLKGSFTRELTELIGPDATQSLIAAFRGHYLWVPEVITPDHPIAQAIGHGPAQALSQRYRDSRILIPMGYAHRIRQRNQQIIAAHQSGASIPDLVTQFDLSPRRLREILSKASTLPNVPVTPQRWTNFQTTAGYPTCSSCPFLAKTQPSPNDTIRHSAAAALE